MTDDYSGLAVLTLACHGDARERDVWRDVAGTLSDYEMFWREFIVLLTNRIVPGVATGPQWIRLRQSIPVEYEQLAMHNYSLFYYAATAWRAIEHDRKRLASGEYPHPERIFTAMQSCVEQAKPLQTLARNILRRVGVDRPELPKHPQDLYETVGTYRNAFAHDPVLGRAVDHGRELLPPKDRLPKNGSPLLWRDAAAIPTAEMIDSLSFESDLWRQLAQFLQTQWKALAEAFVEGREHDTFVQDLGLRRVLPIRCEPIAPSLVGPLAASGIIVAHSDAP
jgi:hypothetical protein